MAASGSQLPFRSEAFDLVYLAHVLGEIPDRGGALRECARVIGPDGVVAVTEGLPDPDFISHARLLRMASGVGLFPTEHFGGRWHYTQRFAKRSATFRSDPARSLSAAIVALSLVATACPLSPPSLPDTSQFELDLEVIRELANAEPGPLPERVNVAVVKESPKPAAGVFGGLRFDTVIFVWTSFQIVYADRFLVVDAPPESPAVQDALRHADRILVTHEHPDHVGGIVQSRHLAEFSDRLVLTKEQGVGVPAPLEPLAYDRHHRVAPGVVLVRAAGHTPGSQLVYVQLRSGRELMLAGDVAWHRSQFELPRGRPRISSWLMNEDAEAVGHQLRKLHELSGGAMLVVVSHDRDQLETYVAEGVLGRGFETR